MVESNSRMRCPMCGTEMNHHADKLVDPTTPEEAAKMDPAMGGLIEETHGCPKCGNVESRCVR